MPSFIISVSSPTESDAKALESPLPFFASVSGISASSLLNLSKQYFYFTINQDLNRPGEKKFPSYA